MILPIQTVWAVIRTKDFNEPLLKCKATRPPTTQACPFSPFFGGTSRCKGSFSGQHLSVSVLEIKPPTIGARLPQADPSRPPFTGERTGNWTTIDCNHPSVVNPGSYTPAQRWSELDADHAWKDVVAVYKEFHQPSGTGIDDSIFATLRSRPSPGCGGVGVGSGCRIPTECNSHAGSGAAGHLGVELSGQCEHGMYVASLKVVRSAEYH